MTAEPPHEFILKGYEVVMKIAKPGYGTSPSCRLTLPPDWAGCEVAVVRLSKKSEREIRRRTKGV